MDFRKLRFEGVYNEEMFNFLTQNGYSRFLFDFSPKSMNFIPLNHFIQLIKLGYSSKHLYFLSFAQDKEFVVNKILDDLYHTIGSINVKNNFYLELDEQTMRELKTTKWPFFLRYKDQMNFSFLGHSHLDLCKGIIIDEDYCVKTEGMDLFEIIGRISIEWKKKYVNKCQFIINNFSKSTIKLLLNHQIDYISLILGKEYESEYRKIDFKLLNSKLKNMTLMN